MGGRGDGSPAPTQDWGQNDASVQSPAKSAPGPPAPRPPLPFELRSDSEQGNPFWSSPNGLIRGGLRQAVHGFEHTAEPGWNPKMGGASQIIRGIGKAALPTAIPFAAVNPITALTSAAAAVPADIGIHYGAKALGASPEGADLAGDIAGAGAGSLGGSVGSRLQGFVGALKNGGRATQDALTDLIPYWGSKINKLRNVADNSPKPFVPGPPVKANPLWRQLGSEPTPSKPLDFTPMTPEEHGGLLSGRVPGTGVPATPPTPIVHEPYWRSFPEAELRQPTPFQSTPVSQLPSGRIPGTGVQRPMPSPVRATPAWRSLPEIARGEPTPFTPTPAAALPSGRVPGTGIPSANPRVVDLPAPGERLIASPSEAATPELRKPEGFSWEGMPRRFELQHLRDRGPLTPVAQAEHLSKWMKSQGISSEEANRMSQGEWRIAAGSAGVPEPSHEIIQAARGQLTWRRGFRK